MNDTSPHVPSSNIFGGASPAAEQPPSLTPLDGAAPPRRLSSPRTNTSSDTPRPRFLPFPRVRRRLLAVGALAALLALLLVAGARYWSRAPAHSAPVARAPQAQPR